MIEQNPQGQPDHSWDETIRTLIFAILIAVVFRSFAFEPFHIPSGSMKKNLLIGDYLFVSKYSYGYSRYSFPLGLPLFKGRILDGDLPKRGEVAVFREPSNPRVDYIKRIIGMPGDKLQVIDGILHINGTALPRTQMDSYSEEDPLNKGRLVARYAETLPEGKVVEILKETNEGFTNNTSLYIVPEGHYFMMGDNRDNSHDSRYLNDIGYVPLENLVGRAEIIFFSTDGTASWSNPISWFTALRTERFFKLID